MCASSAPTTNRLVSTTRSAAAGDLIAALPTSSDALCFVRDGQGLIGWGRHAAISVTGPDAAAEIEAWYADRLAELAVDDEVGAPGAGPVCFVSLGFGPADTSVAIIPQVVLGRRGADGFVTHIGAGAVDVRPEPVRAPGQVTYSDSAMSTASFTSAVAQAVRRINAGEAEKVVLSHGLQATADEPVDERYLLARLARRYPSCVSFALAGLVGASPEMLIQRDGRRITSRVLAGTAWPEHARQRDTDAEVARHLLASTKDLSEHRFAVQSVADVLERLTSDIVIPDRASALELANLTHLATDITGTLGATPPTALEIAAMLHPTAAVGGTPTDVARSMIAELETDPRGRYAAPVGWIDARGDGEFVIALRCAQVDGRSVRLMAGCGIVADSDPATEAREAQIKMIPVRDALENS